VSKPRVDQEHDDVDTVIAALTPNAEPLGNRPNTASHFKAFDQNRPLRQSIRESIGSLLLCLRDNAVREDHDDLAVVTQAAAIPRHHRRKTGAATPQSAIRRSGLFSRLPDLTALSGIRNQWASGSVLGTKSQRKFTPEQ